MKGVCKGTDSVDFFEDTGIIKNIFCIIGEQKFHRFSFKRWASGVLDIQGERIAG